MRFDFTGLGDSEGELGEAGFVSNVDDLVAAADYMARAHEAPQLLIGHSLGGAAILQAAAAIPSALAVATIGAPAQAAHVAHLLGSKREEIERNGAAVVQIAGRSFRIGKRFLDELVEDRLPEAVRRLRRALLIMHAPGDEVVGIDNASRIFQAALHPKSFVSLADADHLLSREDDARYAADVLAAWASRYLPAQAKRGLGAREGEVVARIERSGFRAELDVGGYGLVADEPAAAGGGGLGPTPYGLLSAALGACTAMTLRLYAQRKGWPLDAATVRVTHARLHAEDCVGCDTKGGLVDRFERVLALEGALDAEQCRRLLELADLCPVHRTLKHEVRIDTRLASD